MPRQDLRAVARALRAQSGKTRRALRRANEESMVYAMQELARLSSGTFPASLLRKLGGPYSVAHPGKIPYGHPGWINAQTGTFRAAFVGHSNAHGFEIVNRAPHAKYLLHGTSKMIPRPIGDLAMRKIGPYWARRIARALRGS